MCPKSPRGQTGVTQDHCLIFTPSGRYLTINKIVLYNNKFSLFFSLFILLCDPIDLFLIGNLMLVLSKVQKSVMSDEVCCQFLI